MIWRGVNGKKKLRERSKCILGVKIVYTNFDGHWTV